MHRVLELFQEISQIPRCSHDEKRISDYIVEKAESWNLDCQKDAANNVLVKKPATPGYENHPTVVLQGHVDMVCEKTEDSDHNFSCDAITWIVKDGTITADKTTLGADNGIGIAMALAVLEDQNIAHPALEVLCTTAEEVGLIGANALQPQWVTGKYLINIDTEKEGEITCGCAGGKTVLLEMPIEREEYGTYFYSLIVGNLHGGHSGMEIDQPYLNAIKVATELVQYCGGRLVSLQGGTKHNAIPRSCRIDFSTDKELDISMLDISKFQAVEKNMKVTLETGKKKDSLTQKDSNAIFNMLTEIRHGVYALFREQPDTSANVAISELTQDKFTLLISIRSNHMQELERVGADIQKIAKKNGATTKEQSQYTPWIYRENSVLRQKAKEVYYRRTGKKYRENITHGGLECAVFQEKYPWLDMISIGPNMQYVHTPKESLDIASTERVYEYLIELLGEL